MRATRTTSSATRLVDAIATFVADHRDDADLAELVESLEGITEKVRDIEPAPEESPGRRSAREAAEADNDEPVEAEVPEGDDGREQPRSFGEARERAKERFTKTSAPAGGEKNADARGREGAATASGDRKAVAA